MRGPPRGGPDAGEQRWHAVFLEFGLLYRSARLDEIERRYRALESLVRRRAADPTMRAAGARTGLLERTFRRGRLAPVASYRVDAALVREMLDLLRRAAVLVGEWGNPPRGPEPSAPPEGAIAAPPAPELLDTLAEIGELLGVPFEPLRPRPPTRSPSLPSGPAGGARAPRAAATAPPTFERAALLVALDELGEREIADLCCLPRSSLVALKRRADFRARVREHRAAWRADRPRLPLASRAVRLRELDRLLARLDQIDAARAALPPIPPFGTVPLTSSRPLLSPRPGLGYWGPYDRPETVRDLLPMVLRIEVLDHAAGQDGDDLIPRTAERLPRRARRAAPDPSGGAGAHERRPRRRRLAPRPRPSDGPASWPPGRRRVASSEPLRPAV